MPLLVKAHSFLRSLFSFRYVEIDLDQEVHSHFELLTDEKIRAGMSPEDAQRAARIELGGIQQVKEQAREERIGNWLRSVISDCRHGLRQLRKNPGFTAAAVFTLALGIGANAAIFSVVSAVLHRPVAYRDSAALVNIGGKLEKEGIPHLGPSEPKYWDLLDRSESFSQIAAYALGASANLTSADARPPYVSLARTTAGLRRLLRVTSTLGRSFRCTRGLLHPGPLRGPRQAGDRLALRIGFSTWPWEGAPYAALCESPKFR